MKDDPLDAFLALYSRETRENVLCLRKVLFAVFPNAAEQIDAKAGTITYSLTTKNTCLPVFVVVPHMKHVNLIFTQGAQIPDPQHLLNGSGKLVRHFKMRSESQTEDHAFRQLLQDALKLNYAP
jgi:hypothetical protein